MRTLLAIALLVMLALSVGAQSTEQEREERRERQERRELAAKIDKANENTAELITRVQEHRIAMENRITKIESSQALSDKLLYGALTGIIGLVIATAWQRLTKAKS